MVRVAELFGAEETEETLHFELRWFKGAENKYKVCVPSVLVPETEINFGLWTDCLHARADMGTRRRHYKKH
jgi:hypothetical protein